MDFLIHKACPQCGRAAVEDYDELNDEKFVYCDCCGYNLTREIKYDAKEGKYYHNEIEFRGYGVLVIARKNGRVRETLLNRPLTVKEITRYSELFKSKKLKRKKSYLVLYQAGKFNIIFGQIPEKFHLSYEQFKEEYNDAPFNE